MYHSHSKPFFVQTTHLQLGTNTALNLGAAIANAAAGAVIVGVNTAAAMLLAGTVLIAASMATPRRHLQNSPMIDSRPPPSA